MKKSLLIWIIAIATILLIIVCLFLFISPKKNTFIPQITQCAKAGEISFDDTTGETKQCCSGLIEIGGGSLSQYDVIDGKVLPQLGLGTICSDCGNGVCESWEHKFNCNLDCK